MKIDKRLSEEFGTPLPPVSWLPSVERVVDVIVGGIVPFSVNLVLLAVGAVIGRYYHPAFWWFLGAAGIALLCLMMMFAVVLVANAMDIPHDDMDCTGS